ncbi:PIN domain-containing protein [Caulobacter segnis]|uniref:PIN domain-containing protein n=1 Tax=Caulobacter segnis TaxID=88688 RepID=UPI0024100275|nr:PIN domain-containing protein [Caulobacter segnis]MDG2521239.1 PIN domain-containing protein [Caulobacter segnis]
MAGSFLDTNVLLYLASHDASKAERAEALVAEGGTISVQVLNEMAHVARRKMALTWTETTQMVSAVRALMTVTPLTEATHVEGLRLSERYGLSVYDGQIVAAALNAGCDVLWSEDMHDGLLVDGRLRVTNPFAA